MSIVNSIPIREEIRISVSMLGRRLSIVLLHPNAR
jgi:hypothetical protein